jgi:hypothetical protein
MSDVDPQISFIKPVERARIARTALFAMGLPTMVLCAAVLPFTESHPALSKGILLGHLVAQLMTGIWLAGALLTFDRSNTTFFAGTIGLAPLRFLLVLGVTYVSARYLPVALIPLGLTLVATMVYGHGVEVVVVNKLTAALDDTGD